MAKLQQSFSNLTLCHGLLATEKKASDQKLMEAKEKEKARFNRYGKIVSEWQKERGGFRDKIESLLSTIKEKNKLLAQAEKDNNNNLQATNQDLSTKYQTMASVELAQKSMHAAYDLLRSTSDAEMKDLLHIVNEKDQQFSHKEAELIDLRASNKIIEEKKGRNADILKRLNVQSMKDADKLIQKIDDLDANVRKLQQKSVGLSKNNIGLMGDRGV